MCPHSRQTKTHVIYPYPPPEDPIIDTSFYLSKLSDVPTVDDIFCGSECVLQQSKRDFTKNVSVHINQTKKPTPSACFLYVMSNSRSKSHPFVTADILDNITNILRQKPSCPFKFQLRLSHLITVQRY